MAEKLKQVLGLGGGKRKTSSSSSKAVEKQLTSPAKKTPRQSTSSAPAEDDTLSEFSSYSGDEIDECDEMSDDERDEILRRILRNKIGPTKDPESVSAEEVVGIGELVMVTKGLLMAKGFETSMEGARKQLVEKALRMEAGDEENDEEDKDAENEIVARRSRKRAES